MVNRDPNDEVSDTTGDASSNAAGNQISKPGNAGKDSKAGAILRDDSRLLQRALIFVSYLPMPQDTLYIPGLTDPPQPFYTIIDSMRNHGLREAIQHHVDSLGIPYATQTEKVEYLPDWLLYPVIFLVVSVSVYFYIIRPDLIEKKRRRMRYNARRIDPVVQEIRYDHWLSKYNPYYNSLDNDLKKRFVSRTRRFLEEKEFRFHSMVEEEYIPVMISGAAVQMTFGLKNYLMDYFPVIHIVRKEYVLNIDKETYYGHVSRSGIYISWAHFMEGYAEYSDAVNVGLHEMAHAVSYDVFLGKRTTMITCSGKDWWNSRRMQGRFYNL